MEARNVTIQDLERALQIVNGETYKGNLQWAPHSEPRHRGQTTRSRVSFRLAAIDCKERGGRRGFSRNNDGERRRLGGCACWHAHGHFFEALFQVSPRAVVRASRAEPITGPSYEEGNWRDRQVGSRFDPALFSDLCDCKRGE